MLHHVKFYPVHRSGQTGGINGKLCRRKDKETWIPGKYKAIWIYRYSKYVYRNEIIDEFHKRTTVRANNMR